jgi:hypothetical protein
VTSTSGSRGCRVGTFGTLTITDRSYAEPSGKATARLALPPACRPAGSQWATPAGAIRPLP